MTDSTLIALIAYMVVATIAGTLLVCLSIDFIGDGFEIHDVTVDWPKAVGGLALLVSAGIIAAVRWPV